MKSQAIAKNFSIDIETILVERNLRGMKTIKSALTAGYILRAVQLMLPVRGCVLIGTGFPVENTFETDGPVGAIALYNAFESLGAKPTIVCDQPLILALKGNYRVHELKLGIYEKCEGNLRDNETRNKQALNALQTLKPELIVSIERPGMASDGHYYNMRGENISDRAACFDTFLEQAHCPSIAIGDGGNEIGMGNIKNALKDLDIQASITKCSELIIADVSNWAALGLIAMLDWQTDKDLLGQIDSLSVLKFLSKAGSVDGVSRKNTLTEDGLPAQEGIDLIKRLRELVALNRLSVGPNV